MAKETRKCAYRQCRHGGVVNLSNDEFVHDNKSYYHKKCYREKNDLELIRSLWRENINNTVVYSQLNKELNRLITEVGVSSEYLLFVMQYVISHEYKLRYVGGLKFYVDREEIKEEYEKRTKKKKYVRVQDFHSQPKDETRIPSFALKHKKTGFGSILGG